MDLDYSVSDLEFRAQARAWIGENAPREKRPHGESEAAAYDRHWQRTLHDGGFAGIHWPKDYGGAGLTSIQQMIWIEELARAAAPGPMAMGIALGHAGPTLIVRGTDEQKSFHLPRILNGDAVWCQGFSEPGAGSDLAALKTHAVVEGDELVVNGQKMWTSYAHSANYQELLLRTDPAGKRHRGLTWVICDMSAPGIEIRPITDMMGQRHTNMIFYNDVRIPLRNVVGELGDGWSVAMSTLSFERGTYFLRDQIEMGEKIGRLTEIARRVRLDNGRIAIEDDDIRYRLARLKADTIALRALTVATISKLARQTQPGPESSVMKLFVTTTYKRLSELAAEILGLEFLDYGDSREDNPWAYEFMWSWVLTIAGGSSEIQREIIADRFLELPRAR